MYKPYQTIYLQMQACHCTRTRKLPVSTSMQKYRQIRGVDRVTTFNIAQQKVGSCFTWWYHSTVVDNITDSETVFRVVNFFASLSFLENVNWCEISARNVCAAVYVRNHVCVCFCVCACVRACACSNVHVHARRCHSLFTASYHKFTKYFLLCLKHWPVHVTSYRSSVPSWPI